MSSGTLKNCLVNTKIPHCLQSFKKCLKLLLSLVHMHAEHLYIKLSLHWSNNNCVNMTQYLFGLCQHNLTGSIHLSHAAKNSYSSIKNLDDAKSRCRFEFIESHFAFQTGFPHASVHESLMITHTRWRTHAKIRNPRQNNNSAA